MNKWLVGWLVPVLICLAAISFAATATAAPRVASPGGSQSIPDGSGGTYVAWAEIMRDGHSDEIIVLRLANDGSVAPGWPADGVPICNTGGRANVASVLSDGANGVLVGWNDFRNGVTVADLYMQRVSPAGTPLWTTNGVKVRSSLIAGHGRETYCAADGTGGVVAAWIGEGSSDLDVFATRLNASGSRPAGWAASGNVVCGAAGEQASLALSSDGSGGAYVAWQDGRSQDGQFSLYVQRMSASGAAQWGTDGRYFTNGDASLVVGLAHDGATGAFLLWSDPLDGLTYGMRIDQAGSYTWESPVPLDLPGVMSCSADGLGGVVVCSDDGEQILAQVLTHSGTLGWTAGSARVTSSAYLHDGSLGLVPDGSGGCFFHWLKNEGLYPNIIQRLYAQRIDAAGAAAWDVDGVLLASTPSGSLLMWPNIGPFGSPDGAGGLFIAWPQATSASATADVRCQRLNPTGAATWPAGGTVSFRYSGVQLGCQLVQKADGGVLVFYSEYDAQGVWSGLVRSLDASGVATAPARMVGSIIPAGPGAITAWGFFTSALSDGAGGAYVAWESTRAPGEQPSISIQHVDANGLPLWPAGGLRVTASDTSQAGTRLCSDGAGGLIVTWQAWSLTHSDVFVQRVRPTGSLAWSSTGVPVAPAGGSIKSYPRIAADGAGGAIIFWGQDDPGGQRCVYAQRVDSTGALLWSTQGSQISSGTEGGHVEVAAAESDPSHGALVLLFQSDYDPALAEQLGETQRQVISAQRVDASGARLWGARGAAVRADSSALLYQHLRLASDDSGGAFVGWSDTRSGATDIFAQHLDATGVRTWGPSGVTICNATGWQRLSGMTRDPAGDLYMIWDDGRTPENDVYAQRVNAAGLPQWTTNGQLICGQVRGQFGSAFAPFMAASPARLYAGWADNRAGDARYIYLQRLNLSGATLWSAGGVTSTEIALVSAEASSTQVLLVWSASEQVDAIVERRSGTEDWTSMGSPIAEGTELLRFEDRTVVPGTEYEYRLRVHSDGADKFYGLTQVSVPLALHLALSVAGAHPVVGTATFTFMIPASGNAEFEMLDLAGRRVYREALPRLSVGRNDLLIAAGRFTPGVYMARLIQSGERVTRRIVVLR